MYRCLACGKTVNDYPNPVEHNTHELKNSGVVSRLVVSWEHPHVCDSCKASILRKTADSLEYGNFTYGDQPKELSLLH